MELEICARHRFHGNAPDECLMCEVGLLRSSLADQREYAAEWRKIAEERSAEIDWLKANQQCLGLEGDETGSPCNTYRMLEARYDERLRQAQSERDTAELISLAVDARRKALQEANVKLAGALDMIRETLNGASVQDLLLIINRALEKHHKAMQDEGIANAG